MADTQQCHPPEDLKSSVPFPSDIISGSMSTAETLLSADATPSEASLLGYTEKDSINSPKPNTATCLHGDKAAKARQHSHLGTSVNKQHAEDPMYTMLSSKVTFNYVVPEIIRPLDSYARDYARMAALVDCDPNFSIYRKLRWLHYRVLLHLQAELARLELDLQVIDNKQAERGRFEEQTDLWCDTGDMTRRKKLLAEIKTKLAEYDDLVFRPEKKNAMMRPTRTNQISAMHSACQSLALMEAKWIFRSDDLVAPGDDAAEQSWLNTVVYYARMLAPRLFRAICQSRERRITPPPAYPSTRHAEWTPFIAQSSR